MSAAVEGGLSGLRVLALESRRATEMAELIRRHGGQPIVAPSLREVPLDDNQPALAFVAELERGTVDVVVFLTGVGLRTLISIVEPHYPRERLVEWLQRPRLVARGPKPVAVLRDLGLTPTLTVPEPNTWREILAALDHQLPVAGLRVAVQEYGQSNPELLAGLRARGAAVLVVPVYRWALPLDIAPLRDAISKLVAGEIDIALFTSATQVDHLFQLAEREGIAPTHLARAFHRVLIASIGPVCSEALGAYSLQPDLEPEHSKMGQLVTAIARRGGDLLATKRHRSG